jgi:outer membrane protein
MQRKIFRALIVSTALLLLPVFQAFAAEPAAVADPKAAAQEAKPAPDVKPASEVKQPAPATATEAAPPAAVKKEQTIRIGYVDMAKIASDSIPGKAMVAELKAKTEKYQKQMTAKEKQLQKQKEAIEKQIPTLSPQQRAAKAKEFQKKLEDLQKFAQNADKDIRNKENELLGKLYQSIEKSAGEYGKANGLTAVVMKKELLYTASNVDSVEITGDVLKMVNAKPAGK